LSAAVASSKPGPFQAFYTALLAKGIRPEMAGLTGEIASQYRHAPFLRQFLI
jgi:hypothetical protein